MSEKYEKYKHHNSEVWVNKKLKGKHRDFCLCFSCKKLGDGSGKSPCKIAKSIYSNCVKFNVVTPVFECPDFKVES